MLLALTQWLAQDIRFFSGVQLHHATRGAGGDDRFGYFVHGRACDDPQIGAYKIGQSVRSDGPQTHLVKAGTPTMGGALILTSSRSPPCCGAICAISMCGGAAHHDGLRCNRLGG